MSDFDSEMQVEGSEGWEHVANVKEIPGPIRRRVTVWGPEQTVVLERLGLGQCPVCSDEAATIHLSGKQREFKALDEFVTIWQSMPCECLWAIFEVQDSGEGKK